MGTHLAGPVMDTPALPARRSFQTGTAAGRRRLDSGNGDRAAKRPDFMASQGQPRWLVPTTGGKRCYTLTFLQRRVVVKEGIHPKYFEVEARCSCGTTWKTRSTNKELHLEICSSC